MGFNPRARAGRDLYSSNSIVWYAVFQSTRPRGARRLQVSGGDTGGCFNPRARAGRDPNLSILQYPNRCFNPRARAGRDSSA